MLQLLRSLPEIGISSNHSSDSVAEEVMGLMAWLNLAPKDLLGFVVSALFGYLAGSFMPPGAWAAFTAVLVSYHLFLGWLVSTAEDRAGVSLPIVHTVLTHAACLVVILPLGKASQVLPFFSLFRYGIASLAIFERGWLFSGNNKPPPPPPVISIAHIVAATPDDYQEWLRHLAQQKSSSRKPGASLKAEYEQWLQSRAQSRNQIRDQSRPTASSSNARPGAG
jgi:hypothetical protein